MPQEIRIPRLGWSMEEGTFVGWLKQPGESVAVGEPLFELESDKALQSVESLDAGTLFLPTNAPRPGDTVAVGMLLGYLLAPGEPPPLTPSSPQGESTARTGSAHAVTSVQTIVTPAPRTSASAVGPIASPRARRIAKELGLDWKSLSGTGDNGRVREADVRAAATGVRTTRRIPLSPRRKAIADRLRKGLERTIPVTLTTTADMTKVVAWREQFRTGEQGIVPAYTDIIASVVAHTLARHPRMAVRWEKGQEALIPISAQELHIGIAVDSADGLLVPVMRNVASKKVLEVARATRELVARARQGRLTAAEQEDAVITITNLGSYGIDAFTPVIHYPEIAILGLGAIRATLAQHRITLSLTFDHAAVDGAPAAAFLRDVVVALEGWQGDL